jgi:hypothetical protein
MTFSGRTWWLLLALLTVLTVARVAATHRVFSQVYDEPWHVAAGYDVLTKGASSTLDLDHPPLARVLFALPFIGVPEPAATDPIGRGNALLFADDDYADNLAAARFGNLLFLAVGIVAVALWARHLFTPLAGLVAALLYASLPPILAHAGFATTDMAVAALVPLALYSLTLLLEAPTWPRAALLGVAVAAGMLSKFSFLLYFPAGALVLCLVRRRLPVTRLLGAGAVAFVLVWAAYGFTFGLLQDADPRAPQIAREVFGSPALATALPLPAPAYVAGVLRVKRHDLRGHESFFLGQVRKQGSWYYFPVALFFKTPIPFLILALAGCAAAARVRPELPLLAGVILIVAMTSRINIGVRHVLPIYAPLAIGAAALLHETRVHESRRLCLAAAALVLWLLVGAGLAHPDYLPWFNGFARHPEEILSDSNLDWGQDVLRLADAAQRLGIQRMTVSIFTTAPHDRVGLPPHDPWRYPQPVHGWFAISEMNLAYSNSRPEVRARLDALLQGRPYQRIGKSIRLYRIED